MKMVKVFVAVKRKTAAGRQDGRPPRQQGRVSPHPADRRTCRSWKTARRVDIVLNPLGVPSRMNVGQILETTWAGPAPSQTDRHDARGAEREAIGKPLGSHG